MVLDELRDSTLRRVNGDLDDPVVPPLKGHAHIEDSSMLSRFIQAEREVTRFRSGQPVVVDGHTLTAAGVVAAARFHARIELDDCARVKDGMAKSRKVIADKVESGASVYGLSTGFGGSADTRTDKPLLLGHALLQHQHVGVLPTSNKAPEPLPLLDPLTSTAMPEAWVRGAMLIRMNSLVRGHSGVRWELLEKMKEIFMANITPCVPIRSSISASGDLSPLSYIAGTLVANPSIKVFHTSSSGSRELTSSAEALAQHGIEPIALASKEHLGILNGTAFSASVAALAMHDAVHLALLAQVCTALGTEALRGNRGNYASFIHATARPHPGQVETAQNIFNLLSGSKLACLEEEEVALDEDKYHLRQDRYPLRTAPQFLGPQVEDILSSLASVTLECNSTTDNPLIDGDTGHVHHGGNFQAMAVTNAMEKTRLSLHHIGKLMFAQSTELANNALNNGLPPSLAASDPSLNYHGKGIDIATAAYVAELGHLAAPVSTHIQSAEMHNQAVNSMALVSARSTVNALQVLSILMASYLYLLCQALDLRAMQQELEAGIKTIVSEEVASSFPECDGLPRQIFEVIRETLDKTAQMDNVDRMQNAADATSTLLIKSLAASSTDNSAMTNIPKFQSTVASRMAQLQEQLRGEFLSGKRGPAPAAAFLGKTEALYNFIRCDLGVRMHGSENFSRFPNAIGHDEGTIGQSISRIYEAIRDGETIPLIVSLFQ